MRASLAHVVTLSFAPLTSGPGVVVLVGASHDAPPPDSDAESHVKALAITAKGRGSRNTSPASRATPSWHHLLSLIHSAFSLFLLVFPLSIRNSDPGPLGELFSPPPCTAIFYRESNP